MLLVRLAIQSFQPTFTHQVASSTTPVFQTPQPPCQTTQPTQTVYSKHPTLVLSGWPATTPSTQASSWDTAPPQTGDHSYVSPPIDLEQDSGLEALFEDSPAQKLTQPIQSPSAMKTKDTGR